MSLISCRFLCCCWAFLLAAAAAAAVAVVFVGLALADWVFVVALLFVATFDVDASSLPAGHDNRAIMRARPVTEFCDRLSERAEASLCQLPTRQAGHVALDGARATGVNRLLSNGRLSY